MHLAVYRPKSGRRECNAQSKGTVQKAPKFPEVLDVCFDSGLSHVRAMSARQGTQS
jgi:isoleucyl-tRNA synthetase